MFLLPHNAFAPFLRLGQPVNATRPLDPGPGADAGPPGPAHGSPVLPARPADFRPQPEAESLPMLLNRIETLGAAGKSGWSAGGIEACRRGSPEVRLALLRSMGRHGLMPVEAEQAGLSIPGKYLAEALVDFAHEGNQAWTDWLIHELRHGWHGLHRAAGLTRLAEALEEGDAVAARALSDAGFRTASEPWGPYIDSARHGQTHVLRACIAAGRRFDKRHRHIAAIAAAGGHLDFVRLMHQHGLPLDKNSGPNLILHNAVQSRNMDLVAYLLDHGAAHNLGDRQRHPPRSVMEIALGQADMEMARLLQARGCPLQGSEEAAWRELLARQPGRPASPVDLMGW